MIEHSTDYRRIKRAWGSDILVWSECFYLIETDGQDLGAWLFHPYLDGLKVHVHMDERCRGRHAAESATNAFNWVFENTGVSIIYAGIPTAKKKVCTLAAHIGMQFIFCENGNRCYEFKRPANIERMVS